MSTVRAFLGLGSNIGDRAAYLREAVRRLDAPDLRVTAQSAIYETVPWGVTGQATYLNQVLAVETSLPARGLLERCRGVEAALGRVRGERWGPRTVDVDILLYGETAVSAPDLVVPHRDLPRRAFVLVPLAEIAPDLRLPDGTTVRGLLDACPDREAVWRWDGGGAFGREVRWYDSLPSTNDVARDLALAGAGEGTVIVADRQTAGRGRLERTWASPAGGLWFSIILRPRLAPSETPLVGLAASVAAAEAIEETTALQARVKWPNDVLFNGHKVAGVLLEAGAPGWLVLGIGINVNVAPEALPPRPLYPATSLAAALGRSVQRGPLLRAVLRAFGRHYDHVQGGATAGMLDRWRARSDTLGRPVRIATAAGLVEGLAERVDEAGALLVRTRGGDERRILAGDIVAEAAVEDVR